ncbi:hypothetical protein TNCV_3391 [Trichonephila clavipes]|nr:hypothetical protein TNCV_3391 [Trichonephila clavipes]
MLRRLELFDVTLLLLVQQPEVNDLPDGFFFPTIFRKDTPVLTAVHSFIPSHMLTMMHLYGKKCRHFVRKKFQEVYTQCRSDSSICRPSIVVYEVRRHR